MHRTPHIISAAPTKDFFPIHAHPSIRAQLGVPDRTIVVLEGDETGQELLEEALRVLAPELLGFLLKFERFDLSLAHRRRTRNGIARDAATALRSCGAGIKAATITPIGRDDVGSPNAILREQIGAQVILRVGRRIPGVNPAGGAHAPVAVVRMAVGDAYAARGTFVPNAGECTVRENQARRTAPYRSGSKEM